MIGVLESVGNNRSGYDLLPVVVAITGENILSTDVNPIATQTNYKLILKLMGHHTLIVNLSEQILIHLCTKIWTL